ncbi:MAG TPA: transglutaminase domain-containing protein [Ohtaekwangia sp.]|nr:transglutaminase domain-containing protein [Ohtaekwangia sp.]
MTRCFVATILLLHIFLTGYSQEAGFSYGGVTYKDLNLQRYEHDTSAVAVVLKEFGHARFENSDRGMLLVEYHARIKILRKDGLKKANIEIPLHKQNGKTENVSAIKASSYNIENGRITETPLDPKSVFVENINEYTNLKKFAIPNVREGSIIEISYTFETPFHFNFKTWFFQTDIPKVESEYWATIPGNFTYNISLRGHLKLSKNESQVIKDCYTPGGGYKSDCARFKWSMTKVPAFVEEEYMTAASNFISAIYFELSEYKSFHGTTDKITREWKDVEQELRQHDHFGVQLRKGKDMADKHLDPLLMSDTDPLSKAEKVYAFIKDWYQWDNYYGKYSDGIKKAFEQKKGNVGDINLSLVAALRYAGLDADPMILSTRENGLATELYPVLSDFNYVVAKLNVGDKVYLLDATDDFYGFGMIPERCLNGKGRVLGEKQSYWHDIQPTDKRKEVHLLSLKLADDGITGTIETSFYGYSAVRHRKDIYTSGEQAYVDDLANKLDMTVEKFTFQNVDDLNKPLIRKLHVKIDPPMTGGGKSYLLNPFFLEKWKSNPFKSSERSYPVDFGAPLEEIYVLNIELPETFEATDLPRPVGLSLPGAGGRYVSNTTVSGTTLMVKNSFVIAKTVFTSGEYHYLKELFNHVIASQQTDLVIKKKD